MTGLIPYHLLLPFLFWRWSSDQVMFLVYSILACSNFIWNSPFESSLELLIEHNLSFEFQLYKTSLCFQYGNWLQGRCIVYCSEELYTSNQ
jgi:hypothetical protein